MAVVYVGIPQPKGAAAPEISELERWPDGLAIEAGYVTKDNWTPAPELAESLNLIPIVDWPDKFEDSLANVQRRPRVDPPRAWEFYFTIPEDFAGKSIFFRAVYHFPDGYTYQTPIPTTPPRNRLNVVLPCNEDDRQHALGAHVSIVLRTGNFDEAMRLADSLICTGWRDLGGLDAAMRAAYLRGDYTRELQYLDLNYEANQRTSYWVRNSPQMEGEMYQRARQEILLKIQQQPR